jgi:hypothetical protein
VVDRRSAKIYPVSSRVLRGAIGSDSARILSHGLKAVSKSHLVFAQALVCCALVCCMSIQAVTVAQGDPNAQYILIQSGDLTDQDRPTRIGLTRDRAEQDRQGRVERLTSLSKSAFINCMFNLQYTGDVNWTIISLPVDRSRLRCQTSRLPTRKITAQSWCGIRDLVNGRFD